MIWLFIGIWKKSFVKKFLHNILWKLSGYATIAFLLKKIYTTGQSESSSRYEVLFNTGSTIYWPKVHFEEFETQKCYTVSLEWGFACSSNHIGVKSKLGETNLAPWPFPQTPLEALAQAHMAGPFVLGTFGSGLFDSQWNSDILIICIVSNKTVRNSNIFVRI